MGGGSSSAGGGSAIFPCSTRIVYGSAWLRPAGHTADYDDVAALVTWDGSFTVDASGNSVASLSNGWRPTFTGRTGAVISLVVSGSCAPAAGCATRVTYGTGWLAPTNHSAQYDDVGAVVTSDGDCHPSGGDTYLNLSTGWQPHFSGTCGLSTRYTQCGALYENPVLPTSCPDPGVLKDGNRYVMVCTSGGPGYPIRTSTDLINWASHGTIFTAATKPTWASGDFWAPEIHKVGAGYVAYFSARHTDGHFAIGTATASNAIGPFTAQNTPLVHDPNPGVIDVHEFEAPDGTRYLLWKVDGNAVGAPTPIKIQRLAANGLSLTGTPTTILSNTLSWEGAVVEGPWMIFEGGFYYLFYSANGYASSAYAIGVARSASPTGPFTKAPQPILVTGGGFSGPGHGSVVRGPGGEWVHVFHSWVTGTSTRRPVVKCWSSESGGKTAGPRCRARPRRDRSPCRNVCVMRARYCSVLQRHPERS